MLEAVIFDLDGLIFNTEDVFIAATSEFLEPMGFLYEDQVRRRMMGQQAQVSTAILKSHYQLSLSVDQIRNEIDRIFLRVLPTILDVMPGFDHLIQDINDAKIPAAVCTSSTSDYARSLLEQFGFLQSFQFILGGEEVPNGKPAPDCYVMACQRLGLAPRKVMVLEDSENGLKAAVDAGAFAVAVPGSHNDGHEYQGASLIADTLTDASIREALKIRL